MLLPPKLSPNASYCCKNYNIFPSLASLLIELLWYNQLMIQKIETMLKSKHDGLALGVTIFVPRSKPRGILQLVHGMAEHRRRYYDFMEFCARQGLIVAIHDHRGHGDSIQDPNDLGFFYKEGAKGMISDAHQVTEYLKSEYPGLKLTLLGHSMGSLVVRCYMKQYDQAVDGLIVCGSPSKQVGARAGRLLVRAMKLFLGGHYRSKLVSNALNDRLAKRFLSEGSVNAWIASDPAVVAAFDADEKSGFIFTLNGYEALMTLSIDTYNPKGWQVQHPDVPIFYIAGEEDPCIISIKDFQKAVNFMRGRGYYNIKSKLYPNLRHEILNEKGKQKVWDDVLGWIEMNSI